MKLITEQIEEVKFLTEDNNGKKNHYIQGVFLQGEIKNRNGRVYPIDILEREVSRYTTENISKNRALGELGHPEGPTVNLDRASHKIESLVREGNNYIGKAKLLDTPMGQIAKSLLDEGVSLGVSSRGVGSLREMGGANYVRDDYQLATAADIVADPSAPDAFVEGIMEGKEWVWDNGLLKEQEISSIKKGIDAATLYNLQERKVSAFEQFLKGL
jgi:hypothetical protein|tara:strand:+ start:1504 stop:2148 length:645 start_codon:yes stop_codon:yes gene_type:complete